MQLGDLYLAATYAHGEDHLYIGQWLQWLCREAVTVTKLLPSTPIGKFKPSVAYLRTDVKDDTLMVSFDDTLTEYVSIGAWYNFTTTTSTPTLITS